MDSNENIKNNENNKNSNLNNLNSNIIAQCNLNGKTYLISVDKKVYEKTDNGELLERNPNEEELQFLQKYINPPKSLDLER